jgi:hypothetical protein
MVIKIFLSNSVVDPETDGSGFRIRVKLNHWLGFILFAGGVSEEIVGSETQDRRSGPRRLKCISDVHINSISDPFIFLCRYTRRGAEPRFYGSGAFLSRIKLRNHALKVN